MATRTAPSRRCQELPPRAPHFSELPTAPYHHFFAHRPPRRCSRAPFLRYPRGFRLACFRIRSRTRIRLIDVLSRVLYIDIMSLCRDMAIYLHRTGLPDGTILCADNPRVSPPTIGWASESDDHPGIWSISILDLKNSCHKLIPSHPLSKVLNSIMSANINRAAVPSLVKDLFCGHCHSFIGWNPKMHSSDECDVTRIMTL